MGGWSIFPKLLRSQSQSTARTIIPLLNNPIFSHPPPATGATPPFMNPPPDSQTTAFEIPFSVPPQKEDLSLCRSPSSLRYFPSFSFWFFLNPISSTGSIEIDADGCVLEDSRTIWADSVKKKRKRKMNKHKLRKLRKRLRRKT